MKSLQPRPEANFQPCLVARVAGLQRVIVVAIRCRTDFPRWHPFVCGETRSEIARMQRIIGIKLNLAGHGSLGLYLDGRQTVPVEAGVAWVVVGFRHGLDR